MIEVTFIGTGPSIPPLGRGNTSFVVRSAHSAVLLDCGPTVLAGAQGLEVELRLVPHIFISHCHGDHMLGFPMIMLDRLVASKPMLIPPLNVFCPASMVESLQRITLDVFPEIEMGGALKSVNWHPLPDKQVSTIELEPDLRLTAAPVNGPAWVPTLGARLDFKEGISVAYSSDTGPGDQVTRLAHGCDLLVHEAQHSTVLSPGVPSGYYHHSKASDAGKAAAQAHCRMLALVHLGSYSDGREDAVAREAAEYFSGQIIVPSDGDIVYLEKDNITVKERK